jgi:CDP-diacylglycerol---glycerol-3-phosphate 3-phosphatidyltransferase
MANLITFIRLVEVFIIGAIALYAPPFWQLLNVPLIAINIALDGLDGYIARARNETSIFGAVFDIAADRIIEFVLWIILASIGMISVWIAIVLITRGILIDSLRKPHTHRGTPPFGIMKTNIGKFLVASRTMRFTVGLAKLMTFCWLFFLIPIPAIWPDIWLNNYDLFNIISNILVSITVTICLARGVPVILEALLCKD